MTDRMVRRDGRFVHRDGSVREMSRGYLVLVRHDGPWLKTVFWQFLVHTGWCV